MIYEGKPSENMNLSQSDIQAMLREQDEAMFKAEQNKVVREQAEADRAREEYAANILGLSEARNATINNRITFLENCKNGFMAACLFKLYNESCVTPLSKQDKVTARNLINKFVIEQGAGELMMNFNTKNVMLAEMSRICEKAYKAVVESCDNDVKELKLNQTIVDDFYKDLSSLDTLDASKLIKDRVTDAMSEFIDRNMENKLDCEEIINTAKEKIETMTDEACIEQTMNAAKRRVLEMKHTRQKNIFHYLVEAISKEAFSDETLKARYIHESSVDMDAIVNSAQLIYTMLEMVNTTGMVNADYVVKYVQSLAV